MQSKSAIKKGFTLLEIIAAIAILSIALGYMLSIREENVERAFQTNDRRVARLLARNQLETVLLEGVHSGSGGSFKGTPGFKWELRRVPVQPVRGIPMEELSLTILFGDKFQDKYVLKIWNSLTKPKAISPLKQRVVPSTK